MSNVGVIGEGLLAESVYEKLCVGSEDSSIIRLSELSNESMDRVKFAVVVRDEWDPSYYYEMEGRLREAGITWIAGYMTDGEGIVGPLTRPGIPGCSQCAETRRLMASSTRQLPYSGNQPELEGQSTDNVGGQRSRISTQAVIDKMATLLTAEAFQIANGLTEQTDSHLLIIDPKTLYASRHFFLPDPDCEMCGEIVDDTPEAAIINFKPNPKPRADSYRIRSTTDFGESLIYDYMDARTGIMNEIFDDDQDAIFPHVHVSLPVFGIREIVAGRTLSREESKYAALLEGLERYCGATPRGKRTVVRDSYRHLSDQAIDPSSLGLYTAEQHTLPDFPFEPYTPDQPLSWVWGYSLCQKRPILVPESVAYYGFTRELVYESSSGCALGSSIEEACLYGILEVIERDAFLAAWYAKLRLPRLDPSTTEDTDLSYMIERVRDTLGYEVLLFNMTTDNGVPAIWAIARNLRQHGMNLLCAAGAHLDPIRAAKGAIHELAGILPGLNPIFAERYEEVRRTLRNSRRITKMEDHPLLYGLREAEKRLDFLLNNRRRVRSMKGQSFDNQFGPINRHFDLTDDLLDLIHTFNQLGLDIIIINQTAPELRRNNLHCIKAIIPGMLPMTFGHRYTRLAGLERVLQLPAKLGYSKYPLTSGQLNRHPHPFP